MIGVRREGLAISSPEAATLAAPRHQAIWDLAARACKAIGTKKLRHSRRYAWKLREAAVQPHFRK